MSKMFRLSLLCLCLALMVPGCAYRHYIGMHGPSIQMYPESHRGMREDAQCLRCHHPDRNPEGPPTSHPQFKGCLKCHDG
jgi:hypothetical protein